MSSNRFTLKCRLHFYIYFTRKILLSGDLATGGYLIVNYGSLLVGRLSEEKADNQVFAQLRFFWLLDVLTSCTLSLDSRRHVVAIFSARGQEARFRMRVTLGVILIRSLVYTKHIPGRFRSGSRVALK